MKKDIQFFIDSVMKDEDVYKRQGIDTVLHKGRLGEVYNIGGNNEKANIEIVDLIIANVKEKLSNDQYNCLLYTSDLGRLVQTCIF